MKKTISIVLAFLVIMTLGGVAYGATPSYIEGYFIEALEDNTIMLERYNGQVNRISMSKDAEILIDERPVRLKDFKKGMEVYVEMKGRQGVYIDAYSTSNPGYQQPNSTVVTGIIKNITNNGISLQLPIGEEKTYTTSTQTLVKRNKKPGKLADLYIGDRVKIYTDDNSNHINKLLVEGESVIIKDIYRGELTNVENLTDNIFLSQVDRYRNGSWEPVGKSPRLKLNQQTPIYLGGGELPKNSLKDYEGLVGYGAVKEELGRDVLEKLVLKGDYERNYSTKIENINWFTGQIELANKQNIHINEGTIVIKNGRLVDINSLNPQSDAFIVADGTGVDLVANLIHVYNEDINNSSIGQKGIYAGRVDRIFQDKISLIDFFLVDNNEWISFDESKELYYDEGTFIYDLDKGIKISPQEFYPSKYAVDELNKDNPNRDYYAYLYTDGDRIGGIFLKETLDSLLRQRTTTAVIESNYEDPHMGRAIRVKDAKDWSSKHQEWKVKTAPLHIYLKEAMVIKDGKVIEKTELKPEDRLYLLRDDNMGKVIIVK